MEQNGSVSFWHVKKTSPAILGNVIIFAPEQNLSIKFSEE